MSIATSSGKPLPHPPVGNRWTRRRQAIKFTEPGLTKQEFREECDINNIMKRYEKDGVLTHFNKYQGQYGDFADVSEYHEAMNKVVAADTMFMSLPASIRDRFGNDAGKFLDFVGDEKNLKEMHEMGLLRDDYVPPIVPDPKNEGLNTPKPADPVTSTAKP